MATMQEQETTITSCRGEDFVHIYTANPFHIAKLDKDDRAIFQSGDRTGAEPWATYKVASENWNPLGGFKRRVSEEQRLIMSQRAKERFGK